MGLTIKYKIISGYVIILLLFIGAIIFSVQRINHLKKNVQLTHDHPLTVTRAVIKIEVFITAIHRTMKDVVITTDELKRKEYINKVEDDEKNALEQYKIVKNRILGQEGLTLAINSEKEFINWRPIREDVIALMNEKEDIKAQEITKTTGNDYVFQLTKNLKQIEDYASNKAIGFNKDSSKIAKRTRSIYILLLIITSFISIIISVLVSYSITKRLSTINNATAKMADGNLNQLIPVNGDDELHSLAANFNTMAIKLKDLYSSLELKVEERTKSLEKSNLELNQLKTQLEEKVKERTAELADKVKKLNKNQQEMMSMVESLNVTTENLRKEREKLDEVNSELEAFAYSISHDLRAPLRAIHGFTRILIEEYVEKLDDEGKRIGGIIQDNTTKMGNLIDDLLQFSRMGRASLNYSLVNMHSIVTSVFNDEMHLKDERIVETKIGNLPEVRADENMMKQVWANLISNAIKYSSKRNPAKINVSSREDDKYYTFIIEDNGAGFDMKYESKLFGVFQRLHNETDFPGTGVGLAIVNRIVSRHGGKVTANSEIDKGSKFEFSIPILKQND